MSPKRVLLTGFLPFNGEKINPSELILMDPRLQSVFADSVDFLLLPVVFSEALNKIKCKLDAGSYDMVLMLGQAGGRAKVCLERVALNWIETEIPDESGVKPKLGKIDEDETNVYFTDLPLSRWILELHDQKLPVCISLSAGGYVCNFIYYNVLKILSRSKTRGQACFIHLPYLPEQVVQKNEANLSLDYETEFNTVFHILKMCLK